MDEPARTTPARRTPWRPSAMLAAAALCLSGCAPGGFSSVVVTPARSSMPATSAASAATTQGPSLAAIVDNQLQPGHYASGEQALRRYLKQHPDDRAAQGMLRQLTVDPEQWLGARSRAHVVQPGESYSTLADRYLGDPNLFLILARYNGSTDPSLLRAGQTLRIPLSARGPSPATAAGSVAEPSADTAPGVESPAAKAGRLQDEGVALLGQGHTDQALARMDEALAADPRLKPTGAQAATLRTRLLDSYHERAIVLYRDQQLDQAIALWNRVLAIAPDYEPAVAYRARALELKQRLKQY
ncbi:MAG: LysM peptidoglycan-binding domain-containing protein [Rhodanobacter sp.]